MQVVQNRSTDHGSDRPRDARTDRVRDVVTPSAIDTEGDIWCTAYATGIRTSLAPLITSVTGAVPGMTEPRSGPCATPDLHGCGGTIPTSTESAACSARASSGRQDHPRGRGNDLHASRPGACGCGRDHPRRRGSDDVGRFEESVPARTIPAGAGPTVRSPATSRTSPDHPRGRGANVSGASVSSALGGPSPRGRGADLGGRVRCAVPRGPSLRARGRPSRRPTCLCGFLELGARSDRRRGSSSSCP